MLCRLEKTAISFYFVGALTDVYSCHVRVNQCGETTTEDRLAALSCFQHLFPESRDEVAARGGSACVRSVWATGEDAGSPAASRYDKADRDF